MSKTKADKIDKSKEGKTIAGTDESVQLVPDEKLTVMDLQKRNDVKELNADEEKLITEANQ